MPIVIPNNAEGDIASFFVNKSAPTDLILRLYSNNITPSETDTAATYTEVTGAGYAAITLTPATWTVTEGAPTIATYPQQTFSFTGANGNVYGAFMTRATSGRIAAAERFATAPWPIENNGDQIKVTPSITFD